MGNADNTQRKIHVPILTRVEGEGSLLVKIDDNVVRDVQLAIYEPPRFFEALLRGRPFDDVADFTARICGICPIAYQMTAVQALENAMEVSISQEIRRLRRLMYCGEWIESHVLHIHLLHAPDFFGCDSGIELAGRFPDEVKRGLRMKKYGNRLLEVLGGRAIHPVNLAVGGYYRLPRREELLALVPDFEWALGAAIDTVRWVAQFPFPDFEANYDYVALSHPDEYAIIDGRLVCTDGLDIGIDDFEQHFVEEHVPHSTALQSHRMPGRRPYFVGPLARLNINRQQLSPLVQSLADEIGWETPCNNPYKGIVARALEVVHAFEEGLEILRSYRPTGCARTQFDVRQGHGTSATEAPRGLIYHRYHSGADGKLIFAKIVPPTSQNQAQIEADLRRMLPEILGLQDDLIALQCERLIRSYDPCISCSTHFLKLRMERS